MGILKKTVYSKIDVFVKFESAINLEIKVQIKNFFYVFVKFESAINLEIRGQKKIGFLLFGLQGP